MSSGQLDEDEDKDAGSPTCRVESVGGTVGPPSCCQHPLVPEDSRALLEQGRVHS